MVNTKKLKGKIIEKGSSIGILAEQIGINRSTLYRKLKGQCPLTINDADLIAMSLNLSSKEAHEIFFSQFVA